MLRDTETENVRENSWLRSVRICPGGGQGGTLIFWKVFTKILTARNLSVIFHRDFKSFLKQHSKTLKATYNSLKRWCKDVGNCEKGVWEVGLNKRRYLISFGASSSSYLFFSFLLIVSLTTRKRRESPTTTPHTAPAIMLIFCASGVQKKTNLSVWSRSSPRCKSQRWV